MLEIETALKVALALAVFSSGDGLRFHEATLTQDDITDTQESIQKRVLRYFCNRKFFGKDELEKMFTYENSGFSLDASVKIPSFDTETLERLIRYCARPPFNSENIRVHSSLINYRFPKPSHDGRLFMTLDPLDFLERISHFIPYPRRHRRHYHGVLAPSSPLRKQVAANAQKRLDVSVKTRQERDEKVTKASRGWAQLIARIYEVDSLTCAGCGKKIKIMIFATHPEHIRRILRDIGWPITIPEFDPPPAEHCDEICQLALNAADGFSEPEVQAHFEIGQDPPTIADIDPPHWED